MMKTFRIFFICALCCFMLNSIFSFASEEKYCVAVSPCPVLNTPEFGAVFGGEDGRTLKLDENGLIREVEFVALAGTAFEIVSTQQKPDQAIIEVKTAGYPSQGSLYIDSRFVAFVKERPPERAAAPLSVGQIISALKSMEGSPYTWGGNYNDGIDQMLVFYPPAADVSPEILSRWRLKGVDCSGLIYQASDGYTPRNTFAMTRFGQGIKISGLSPEEIAAKVRPLDLIVLSGHVVIVLDSGTTIESSHRKGGVVISDLIARLEEIMSERSPVDEWDPEDKQSFVIRRWNEAE